MLLELPPSSDFRLRNGSNFAKASLDKSPRQVGVTRRVMISTQEPEIAKSRRTGGNRGNREVFFFSFPEGLRYLPPSRRAIAPLRRDGGCLLLFKTLVLLLHIGRGVCRLP